jgi:antitoxin component of RelBE/YafQ-DinJ toxin-antitoxin module
MTTLTIRIDESLKSKASKQAERFGLPLTLIVKNSLRQFIANPIVVINEIEEIEVTPSLQAKMDEIGALLSKKLKKKDDAYNHS